MNPFPQSKAKTPIRARGSSVQLMAAGFSIRARVVTEMDPKTVPRIVCGLRNFQKAFKNWLTLSTADSDAGEGVSEDPESATPRTPGVRILRGFGNGYGKIGTPPWTRGRVRESTQWHRGVVLEWCLNREHIVAPSIRYVHLFTRDLVSPDLCWFVPKWRQRLDTSSSLRPQSSKYSFTIILITLTFSL